jgi:protein-S-isoprenylcysteine O-methyltransferase Ste14
MLEDNMGKDTSVKLDKKIIIKSFLGIGFIAAFIFICAGKVQYFQGILFLSLTILMLIVAYIFVANNPALINERFKPGKGIKKWDKIFLILSPVLFFIMIGFASIDSGRLNISPKLPFIVYVSASIIFIIGNLIFSWARRTNNFFSTVVRIQSDRGHSVCKEGPYQYVRHPGYFGTLLYTAVTPFLLGSLWALIPNIFIIILIFIRTGLEDKTLAEELAGYKDFQKQVKYRLLPFFW